MLRIQISLAALVALGALGTGACKRDPGAAPPCGAVGAKLLVIARAELEASRESYDEATRRAVLDQLPAMRDALVHACTDTSWGEGVRRCLVDAPDPLAFEACQQQLTEPQRQGLDRPSPTASP